jgi:hypothetical protein
MFSLGWRNSAKLCQIYTKTSDPRTSPGDLENLVYLTSILDKQLQILTVLKDVCIAYLGGKVYKVAADVNIGLMSIKS